MLKPQYTQQWKTTEEIKESQIKTKKAKDITDCNHKNWKYKRIFSKSGNNETTVNTKSHKNCKLQIQTA